MKRREAHVTQAAFKHALLLIKENYPEFSEELQIKKATELAAKICKKEKR